MRDLELKEAAEYDLGQMLAYFGGTSGDADWESFESVALLPDFNVTPLNGKDPSDVQSEFGVKVEIVGPWDEGVKAHPIIVGGLRRAVRSYLRHLRSTWPQNEA